MRFSWVDHTSAFTQTKIVVTYALDEGLDQVTRRLCTDGQQLSMSWSAAASAPQWRRVSPARPAQGNPRSVLLTLNGSSAGAPEI